MRVYDGGFFVDYTKYIPDFIDAARDFGELTTTEFNEVILAFDPAQPADDDVKDQMVWTYEMAFEERVVIPRRPAYFNMVPEMRAAVPILQQRLARCDLEWTGGVVSLLLDWAPVTHCHWAGDYANAIISRLEECERYKTKKGESLNVMPHFDCLQDEGDWHIRGAKSGLRSLGYMNAVVVTDLRDWLHRDKQERANEHG